LHISNYPENEDVNDAKITNLLINNKFKRNGWEIKSLRFFWNVHSVLQFCHLKKK